MFTFRTPLFHDGAEEAPGGAGVAEAQPTGGSGDLGYVSPDEQTFDKPGDFRAARQALLREPPVVLHDDSPTPPAEPVDPTQAAIDELTTPPAAPATPTQPGSQPGTPDPYEQFGGVEAIINARNVAEALRTEQGIKGMVGQGLIALGYSPEAIQAFVEANKPGITPSGAQAQPPGAPPAAPVDPFADLDDGDVVTGADLKQAFATLQAAAAETAAQQAAAQTQPLAEQLRQAQEREAQHSQQLIQQSATATYHELLGQPPAEPEANRQYLAQAARIQQLAETQVVPGSTDPAEIRRAIIAGHAMFVDEMETAFRGYVGGKKAAAQNLPTNIGGGSQPGGEPVKEPINLADARKQAKAAGFFG